MAKQERTLDRTFKLTGYKKYLLLLEMFSFMKPLNTLSPREKQVLAFINRYYNVYEFLPIKDGERLVFDYDTRQEIAETLKIKKQVVYNLFLALKKKGIIGDSTIDVKYMFGDIETLTISFNE